MYQTVLSSGSGKTFTDVDGKQLVSIGNVTHKAGDAVWTDGKCIYGWVRTNQSNFLPEFGGLPGCPWIDTPNGSFTPFVKVLSFASPTAAKRLCQMGDWAWGASLLVAGKKTCYLVQSAMRRAVNLYTGEKIALSSPAGMTGTPMILDALVDENGNLWTLETYFTASVRWSFVVEKNGSIEKNLSDGVVSRNDSFGMPMRLAPLAMRLRADGTFCGTMTEETQDIALYSTTYTLGGIPSGTVTFTSQEVTETQTGDITEMVFQTRPDDASTWVQPFEDAILLKGTTKTTSNGRMYYYNDGALSDIYSETTESFLYPVIGAFDVPGAGQRWQYDYPPGEHLGPAYAGFDRGVNVISYSGGDGSEPAVVEFSGGMLGQELVDKKLDFSVRAVITGVSPWKPKDKNFSYTSNAYSFDMGGGLSASCASPQTDGSGSTNTNLHTLLPSGYGGTASLLGVTVNQSEDMFFDAVKISETSYLVLTGKGLFLSENGQAQKIHDGFRGASGSYMYNARIRETRNTSRIRSTLKKNDIERG